MSGSDALRQETLLDRRDREYVESITDTEKRHNNAASEAFAASPERIYVVGVDGRIAFKGGPGPWSSIRSRGTSPRRIVRAQG